MKFLNTEAFANELDLQDPLRLYKQQFYIPIVNGKESIYFNGNSLGLQPKAAQVKVLNILQDWANYGVEGHFHGKNPWISYHDKLPPKLSKITGALPEEIVIMNFLTVNLHLLFSTFYRPTKDRFKIICESKAFPSDQFAFESQASMHGLKPEDVIIEIPPRKNEHHIRQEDILKTINKHGDSVSIVLFSGVNYYTGQRFDMEAITNAAHHVGAYCGFDLAHAVGNVHLELHKWNVDFAVWCNYKYLNAGPGAIGGAFIHKNYSTNISLPRLAGWWGHDKTTRFQMEKGFKPIASAEGWQLSTPPGILMSILLSSLDIYEEAGLENIFKKSIMLSDFLFHILDEISVVGNEKVIEIITPRKEKGCQVSMLMLKEGKKIFNALKLNGVIADWREPNVIRIAPVPLYNSFEDVYKFGVIMKSSILGK